MTFWSENRTKLLGSFVAVVSAVTVMISSGTFEGLLSDVAIRWLSIICQLLVTGAGAWTIGVGFSNTTKERVAQAAATVAVAEADTARIIDTALHTEPPKE